MSFKLWNSYSVFDNAVQTQSRYILDDTSKDFLQSIIETCADREHTLKSKSIVWRAQNGHGLRPFYQTDPDSQEEVYIDDFICPFPNERMKPLRSSASEGRANPKGIPCLYVATDKETAMSEVRPWLGSIITVGKFEILRDLKILDFSVEHGNKKIPWPFKKYTEEETLKAVWSAIDNAFSKPIKSSDLKSEYASTQIISEYVKSKGYDGIAYKSSLSEGHNVALFDLDSAEIKDSATYESTKITYGFSEIRE